MTTSQFVTAPKPAVRDSGVTIEARFRNPAMPSVVSQSDAMVKQISALPWLAESDVALEELGYSEDQIIRLRSDRAKTQSRSMLSSLFNSSQDTAEEGSE